MAWNGDAGENPRRGAFSFAHFTNLFKTTSGPQAISEYEAMFRHPAHRTLVADYGNWHRELPRTPLDDSVACDLIASWLVGATSTRGFARSNPRLVAPADADRKKFKRVLGVHGDPIESRRKILQAPHRCSVRSRRLRLPTSLRGRRTT